MTRRACHNHFVLAILVILIFAGSHERAQERTSPPDSPLESLQKAEAEIQQLQSGVRLDSLNVAMRAWRRLKAIVPNANDAYLRVRVARDMIPLEEILGYHDLQIANFYLSREHGGIKGAEDRLLYISEEYPDFSKMDEVLLRLSDASLRDGNPNQARTYLGRLVCTYPGSANAKAAFDRLSEIGFDGSAECDKYKK